LLNKPPIGALLVDFEKEEFIRSCSLAEIVKLMKEIADIEGGLFEVGTIEDWFSKSDRFLAAVFDGKIIGAISFSTKGIENVRMPVLDFVNVLRPFRGKRVATRLCISAITELVQQGITPIHCTALNPDSLRFLKSLPKASRNHLRIKKAF
jgi:hypothetical protein